jgi:hypothetical protein
MGWMEALRGVGWKHRRVYGQVRCGVRTPWFYRLGLACLTRRVAAEGSAGVGGWLRPVGGVGPFGAAGLDLSRRGAGNPRNRCAVWRSYAFSWVGSAVVVGPVACAAGGVFR